MIRRGKKPAANMIRPRTALLKDVDSANAQGPFRADWESLQKFEVPEWYRDAKFGIFIHWGVVFGPRLRKRMVSAKYVSQGSEEYKHHIATYGPQTSSDTKTSFPCSKQNTSMRRLGPGYSRRLVRNTWFPWPSITMVLPCTTVA